MICFFESVYYNPYMLLHTVFLLAVIISSTFMCFSSEDMKRNSVEVTTRCSSNERRWGVNSAHSTQGVDLERQRRLEEWLNTFLHRQMFINNSREIVIYRLSEYGGFGNVIRGYFTSMLLVVLYDTCLKGGDTTRISSLVDSFHDYLRLFFFSPFPNTGSPFERNDREDY